MAAGTAAIMTSYFWQRGTLISAAMTPVIVTVVSEMLKRPANTVRRAARSARSSVPARDRVPLAYGAGAGPPAVGPSRELPAPGEPERFERPAPASSATMSEYKVYRSESRRPRFGRIHWKIVLATAAIAFVIAVGALTLPELLFGSSVSGSRGTTFFGGTASTHQSDKQKTSTDEQKTTTDNQKTTTDEQKTTTQPTETAPTQSTPTQSTPAPQPVAPQQQTPSQSPSTSTPQQQAPAPQQQQQAPAPSG
jgi:hypothetical protein